MTSNKGQKSKQKGQDGTSHKMSCPEANTICVVEREKYVGGEMKVNKPRQKNTIPNLVMQEKDRSGITDGGAQQKKTNVNT
jgi:hypothetical protein